MHVRRPEEAAYTALGVEPLRCGVWGEPFMTGCQRFFWAIARVKGRGPVCQDGGAERPGAHGLRRKRGKRGTLPIFSAFVKAGLYLPSIDSEDSPGAAGVKPKVAETNKAGVRAAVTAGVRLRSAAPAAA